jgi:opacity protein-like surface antigen
MNRRQLSEISAFALLLGLTSSTALGQEALPDIDVSAAKPHRPKPAAPAKPQPAAAPVTEPQPSSPVLTQSNFDDPSRNDPNGVKPPRPLESASTIYVSGEEVRSHSYTRPGEALEIVPGLLITQHSGEGKANQYQLRGFQLDHGTDLAIWYDGMPLNMPTHGHGQGYADANFLIPELFDTILAHKGPYFADEGDFSAAGAVHINIIDSMPGGLISATAGSYDYGRLLGITSNKLEGGNLLSAVELGYYNGPWTIGDQMHKINGVLRWSQGTQENGFSITGMAYANDWHASNQIPERAVSEGVIPLWGNIDPTDRGDTTRFSLSTRWSETDANSHSRIEAFVAHTTLDLYNDFDYYLTQPIIGDQFRQFDRRTTMGINAEHGWKYGFAGYPVETRIGLQSRYDNIRVGLQDTTQTVAYATVENDQVAQGNIGVWTDTTVKWTPWLRTTTGIRYDFFAAAIGDYQNPLSAPTGVPVGTPGALPIWTGPWNSGHKADGMDSPKLAITLGPWEKTEFFINAGEGFHSVDARATVTTLNPGDGTVAATTPFLVKARGAEVGARTKFLEGLDSTISLWGLNFDSESQFDGDTGTTLFGRPSRRYGVELANHYSPTDWAHFDGDLSLSHARSRGFDTPQLAAWSQLITPQTIGYFTYLGNAPGNYIPEGPPVIASVAVELGKQYGWFAGLKYRFKGAYPLTEDGYFKAPATGTVNLRVGYKWENGLKLQIDGYNALNSRSDQITYAYGSLLPTDPLYAPCVNGTAPAAVCAIGQMDRHFKPIEPGVIRVTLSGPLSPHAFDPIFAAEPSAHTPYKDFLALASDVSNGNVLASDESASLPNKKGPPPVAQSLVSWTGLYVGVSAGDNFGSSNLNVVASPLAASGDLGAAAAVSGAATSGLGNFGGFIGGGQVGYNWQLGDEQSGRKKFVAGIEADIQGTGGAGNTWPLSNGAPSTLVPANNISGSVATSYSLDYIGTVRTRVGYLLTPSLLAYGSGGLAYGQANLITQTSLFAAAPSGALAGFAAGSANYSNLLVGWTAGGGMEWMFHPNWSVKAEYLYYDLGAVSTSGPVAGTSPSGAPFAAFTLASQASARFNGHIVRGGVNYHFDFGAPSPILAKY